MQSARINTRLPQVYRACRVSPSIQTRKMAFFPRYIQSEFAPMFRLLDDYAQHAQQGRSEGFKNGFRSLQSFTPKFDVKESEDKYELAGELPGIEQKNVEINFTDANTLQIKGRVENHREEGTRPAGLVEGQSQQSKLTQGEGEGESETSSSYQKASVEDESTTAASTSEATPQESEAPVVQNKADTSKYWVSERSVGEFARTFSFPSRIDQDNVKAGLKNGILSIVVPKAAAPQNKRINIE